MCLHDKISLESPQEGRKVIPRILFIASLIILLMNLTSCGGIKVPTEPTISKTVRVAGVDFPAFSPNGYSLAFTSTHPTGAWQKYINPGAAPPYARPSAGIVRLTSTKDDEFNPNWSSFY